MKIPCEVIRDLLPLYADDACSSESRQMVEEHLQDCPGCTQVLGRLRNRAIEADLIEEKNDVIEYGAKQLKKRSARVGGTVSGIFMIPILVCLIINITTGAGMGWFFIVLSALLVAASLILVPVIVPESKGFWTLCAFTVSLVVLLGVTCAVSGGNWFWVAASASLFGLGLIFLPFAIRAKPLQRWIGQGSKALIVVAADLALFLNMMTMINVSRHLTASSVLLFIGCLAGIGLAGLEIYRKKGGKS